MTSQRCQPFNVMLYPVCCFLLIVPFIKSVEIEVALLVVYTAGVAILHLDYGIFVVSYDCTIGVSISPSLILHFLSHTLVLISCLVRIYCIPQFLHKEGHMTANCEGPIDHYRKFLLLMACCICLVGFLKTTFFVQVTSDILPG